MRKHIREAVQAHLKDHVTSAVAEALNSDAVKQQIADAIGSCIVEEVKSALSEKEPVQVQTSAKVNASAAKTDVLSKLKQPKTLAATGQTDLVSRLAAQKQTEGANAATAAKKPSPVTDLVAAYASQGQEAVVIG